jgi:hypothetical protein
MIAFAFVHRGAVAAWAAERRRVVEDLLEECCPGAGSLWERLDRGHQNDGP